MKALILVAMAAAGCQSSRAIPSPPAGGDASNTSGSGSDSFAVRVDQGAPVRADAEPERTTECLAGERMWCDSVQYDGWGQVECDPATGAWRTKLNDAGQTVLDCRENLPQGRVPATACACYHYWFTPACCERIDCIVPAGSTGQICPPSEGGLCDYCNPQAQDCKTPGALCIVTNAHETFCGAPCPCPSGYACMDIKTTAGTKQQCVPEDLSCYYY